MRPGDRRRGLCSAGEEDVGAEEEVEEKTCSEQPATCSENNFP